MKESDIRPRDLADQYLALSLQDAKSMDQKGFVSIDCPACKSKNGSLKFKKNGFTYQLCDKCSSLFCSPRPTKQMLDQFYEKGESSVFWATVFFPAVAESRREKLFRKKAQKIRNLFDEKAFPLPKSICDVGAGYGIFLEELRQVLPDASLHAIEPGQELAKKCIEKGFETLDTVAENAQSWENRFELVISSEVAEHVFDPEAFVRSLYSLVKPGGRIILTGLGYEGFDILTLQEKSKSVFPPHHINFLSIEGFHTLFQRIGFKGVEVWTPGELDVDIVMNSGNAPDFLGVLAKRPNGLENFQKFLSGNNMSSHIWVMATK